MSYFFNMGGYNWVDDGKNDYLLGAPHENTGSSCPNWEPDDRQTYGIFVPGSDKNNND